MGQVGTFKQGCPFTSEFDPETKKFIRKPQCEALPHITSGTINWGDGSPESGASISKMDECPSNICTLVVGGNHVYPRNGTYKGTVRWQDTCSPPLEGCASSTFNFGVTVADAPITIENVKLTRTGSSVPFKATISGEINDGAPPEPYTATVDWADMSVTHPVVECVELQARVHPSRAAGVLPCSFTATHEYASKPNSSVVATVRDPDSGKEVSAEKELGTPADVETRAAASVLSTSAVLTGHVNAHGFGITNCLFEWGAGTRETVSYDHQVACTEVSPPLAEEPNESTELTGLSPSQSYTYRIVATTEATGVPETVTGAPREFSTLAPVAVGAPSVVTQPASAVSQTSALLHGAVNSNGGTIAVCRFEWGPTTSYGQSVPCSPAAPAGPGFVAVSASLAGLGPGTIYHLRLVAANAGSAESRGADEAFATSPSCEVHVKIGYLDALGCFRHGAGTLGIESVWTSVAGSTVQLDGLTVTPQNKSDDITIDVSAFGAVRSSGPVTVKAGNYTLYKGTLDLTQPRTDGIKPIEIAVLKTSSGTGVGGFGFDGPLTLSLNRNYGTDVHGSLVVPFGQTLQLNGSFELHTLDGVGLAHDRITITRPNLELFSLKAKNLHLTYSSIDDLWEGGLEVELPTESGLTLGAGVGFQHGNFHRFEGSVDHINAPLVAGAFLQRVSIVIGVDPTTIGGGLGLSWGPEYASGVALFRLNGGFVYTAPFNGAPGHLHIGGEGLMLGVKLATAYFDYFTNGHARFGAEVTLAFPDFPETELERKKEPVYINAALNGAFYQSKFDVDVTAEVYLNFINVQEGAELLISDKGAVACVHLSAFGFSWSPGASYTWATHDLELMWHRCSVEPFRTLELGAIARAAASGARVKLLGGGALLGLTGASGAPVVTLRGPHGQSVSVPANSSRPLMVPGFMVLQDAADKTTFIAIQHSAGIWHITRSAGSSTILKVRSAGLLPEPRVTARVSGSAHRHLLSWNLRQIPGQRVTFWERGPDSGKVLGSTSSSSGSLRFTPASGSGGRRKIIAQVFSFGAPRKDLVVASYTAPRPARPGRPGHLHATAAGRNLRVSWTPATGAQRYVAEVLTADHERLVEFLNGSARGVTFTNVIPIPAAIVRITPKLSTGVIGPSTVIRLPAPPPKKKKKGTGK